MPAVIYQRANFDLRGEPVFVGIKEDGSRGSVSSVYSDFYLFYSEIHVYYHRYDWNCTIRLKWHSCIVLVASEKIS